MRRLLLAAVISFVCAQVAFATGFMMPDDRNLSCLQLESHRVSVKIADQSAVTHVEEVFRNQHDRQLEATFVFPLPEGASVSDFKMYVNGELVTGKIMEAGEAREIYQSIVRRMRDPGLLEYMDSRSLKLSVFPILPKSTQTVKIEYSQTLRADEGLVEYVYPLKSDSRAASTMKDFTLSLDISASAGIRNVYSPTHDVSIHTIDDHHVKASFEKEQALLDKDFEVFYALTDKAFGASVLSYRPEGKDGYFLLILSPKVEVAKDEIVPKDVAFICDTSGSMKGDKISQAKKALTWCVSSLSDKDRFTVVTFSDDTQVLSGELLDATKDNRDKAAKFIDAASAAGGTDIDTALAKALAMQGDAKRPYFIVFLTDGVPTVGKTNAGEIVKSVKDRDSHSARIFSFGVGNDVNTKLLDELAQVTGGVNQYVHPDENIEVKVSSFFNKIGAPLLSDVSMDYGSADVRDVYPKAPGDLFHGSEIIVTGRYAKAASTTIVLRGKGPSGKMTFEYPVEFTGEEKDNKFVASIWAGRKIAFLLGEIRLHGENSELKDEVIRLSKEFGIMTPYTSYLVKETENMPQPVMLRRQRPMGLEERKGDMARAMPAASAAPMPAQARMEKDLKSLGYTAGDSGSDAVKASEAYRRLTTGDKLSQGGEMRSASGRTFVNVGGVWSESGVTKDMKPVTVKFGSDAYFRIVKALPALRDAFALGDQVILAAGKYCLVVGDDGAEDAGDGSVTTVIEALAHR
jgi:Ca-activated chloride channel homolog